MCLICMIDGFLNVFTSCVYLFFMVYVVAFLN